MARLLIVRHAETAHNHHRRIQGHIDSDLTSRGRRQTRRLAKRLKKFKIDKIYTSDLGRAYLTAKTITRHTKLRIIRDPLLREIYLGKWEGLTAEEVDSRYNKGYRRWKRKPSAARIPGAEGVRRFKKRVVDRVRTIARANRGKTVLIVTHGGVITALLSDWLKADFDHLLLNLQIDNTSLTLVEQTALKARLCFINSLSHLDEKVS